MTNEAARDRQVAIETVRPREECPSCNPGEVHEHGDTVCEHCGTRLDRKQGLWVDQDGEWWCASNPSNGGDAAPHQASANTEPASGPLTDTLDALEHLVGELNVHAMGLKTLEWEELVVLLGRVQLLRDAMQTIEAGFLDAAWKAKGDRYGDVEHPTLGLVEVRRGKNRAGWDHDALAGAVLDRHLSETGEVPDPGEVKRWLMDAAGIAYWRKGELKELGIDVDEYCVSTPGRASIRVVRPGDTNPLLLGGSSPD